MMKYRACPLKWPQYKCEIGQVVCKWSNGIQLMPSFSVHCKPLLHPYVINQWICVLGGIISSELNLQEQTKVMNRAESNINY